MTLCVCGVSQATAADIKVKAQDQAVCYDPEVNPMQTGIERFGLNPVLGDDKRCLRLMVLSAMVSRAVSISITLKSLKDQGLAPEEETVYSMVMRWSSQCNRV